MHNDAYCSSSSSHSVHRYYRIHRLISSLILDTFKVKKHLELQEQSEETRDKLHIEAITWFILEPNQQRYGHASSLLRPQFLNVFHCNLLIELEAFTKKLLKLESGQKVRIFYH